MAITLPDHIPALQRMTEPEVRRELAVAFYGARKLTLVQAADVAQSGLFEFQALLRDRRIPQHYDESDLDQDLLALRDAPTRGAADSGDEPFDGAAANGPHPGLVLELPGLPAGAGLSPAELRLELACALHDRGRLGKVAGTELAGVDFFTFQRALGERGMAAGTEDELTAELATLRTLFPQ